MDGPPVTDRLDADVARLAGQLAEDDHREIAALFQQARAARPQLLWNPLPSQLPIPAMAALLGTWEARGGRRRAAMLDGFLDDEPAAVRDWVVRADVMSDGEVVYAEVGDRVIDTVADGGDERSLDRLVSRVPAPLMLFYAAGYQACRQRQLPFLTFNESPQLRVRAVSRLVLPLWDATGAIRHFVTMVATVDRDGTLSQA